MKKALLGLFLLVLSAGWSMSYATNTDCWEGKGTVPTTTYASGIVYGCDENNIPVITIYGDDGKGITIKAMNEGTGTITIGSLNDTGAYGSLYQRGNNYPFPNATDVTTIINSGTEAISAEGYGPQNYYNSYTWIKQGKWDISDNRNLWGGSGDEKNLNGFWGFDTENFEVINATDRQAMCPEGYHIPSIGEWSALLYLWGENYDENQGTSLFSNRSLNILNYKTSLGGTGSRFSEDMQIPFVGHRNYDSAAYSGDYADYWSSSPNYNTILAHFFALSPSYLYADTTINARGLGYAVRCFKNEYVHPTYSLTFDSQGGSEVDTGIATVNTSRTRPDDPTKSGYTFVDWYTSTGYEDVFDFTGTLATGDLTVYAKWHDNRCGADLSLDYDEENELCYKKDTTYNVPIYYGTDINGSHSYNGNPIGTITIFDPSGSGDSLTIMNMNLGASAEGGYGDLYQWGNNTPFTSSTSITQNSYPNKFTGSNADYNNYRPGHEYNDPLFRLGGSNYRNRALVSGSYVQNWDNLRGGMNDQNENRGGINNGETRQGPCPVGYHVPSIMEWNTLITYWYNTKNPSNPLPYSTLNSFENDIYFKQAFKIPLAGRRNHYSTNVVDRPYNAHIRSSSSNSNGTYARNLVLGDARVFANYGDDRTDACSIRCFKNSPNAKETLILTFDENGGNLLGTTGTDGSGTLIQKVASGKLAQQPVDPTKTGATFQWWSEEGDEDTAFDFSAPITETKTLKAIYSCETGYKDNGTECVINKDIVIEATATESDQTLKINKYFANAYTVDWGDGTTGNLTTDTTHTYSVPGTYTIILSLSGANRWIFQSIYKPLVPTDGTTVADVKIVSMPSLADGFGNSATNPGNYFFYNFNSNGKLTSLPEGSFDTSKITTVGDLFFYSFNWNGKLTSLPEGSFDTSNITTVGNYFFGSFNYYGQLTSLPEGSFRLSTGLTTVGSYFFYYFNSNGELTSLPEGSFDTSNITKVGSNFFYYFNSNGELTSLPEGSFRLSTGLTTVGSNFFSYFNSNGKLTSLPEGSFDTSKITTVGDSFFYYFNNNGKLTSLPEGSFDTSKITTVGGYGFFSYFNYSGELSSLPEGSFRLSTGLTTVGDYFFSYFNSNGKLTSLPSGSFDTSKITTVGDSFFYSFNYGGQLISLPSGSFRFSTGLTSVGSYFFNSFNYSGALTSLPSGSFDTSKITSVKDYFFYRFNKNGQITNLPDSFTMNSAGASNYIGYQDAFNSPNYILNRNVSEIVSGITPPSSDRNTFSDNQPGRCGVHENWLVTTADACSISYDDGLGGTGEFKYTADTTGVVVGSGMVEPEKVGYIFSGWIDASGNRLDEVVFPDMDGQTLYANWNVNQYTITFKDGENEITAITADYGTGITPPSNPTKNGYRFIGWEPEVPATMPAEDLDIKAVWERNGSSGGGGGGGGGGSSSSSSSTGSDTSNQQSGSGTNNSTGTQNDQTTTGTIANEPEGTGNNTEIQTGNQTDTPEQNSQDNNADTSNNTTEGQNNSQGSSTYSTEFQEAYEFAKGNGITTMPTIQKAEMYGKLTRIAMAKMLSQYAINVLEKEPDTTQNIKFNDVTDKQNSDYDDGVTLAYQLGIMGQNMPGNNFRPNDEVTRAEFATALSRMLYNTSDGEYKSTSEYYVNHMKKLVKEGIITKDDPNMKELRGYVMIMLMRSAK